MRRHALLTAVAGVVVAVGVAAPVSAQAIDPPAKAAGENSRKELDQSEPAPGGDKPKKPDLKEDLKGLTEDLLDLVVGPKRDKKGDKPAPEGPAGNNDPLESAIEGMRKARQRMADKETGSETRDIQEQVIKDLEKLIQQSKNPPKGSAPPPPQSSQNQNPRNNRNQDRQKSPQPNTPEDQKQETGESGDAQNQQKTESEKARESSEEARAAREREAELSRRRDLVKDVWGHLPPALRQKLLHGSSDKSLPRYDELIRRYFESLAEEGSTMPPRRKP
ncbi:MAG: hypothetical protein IT428_27730 [Planctomycetaceae bacterium]|nr:hypothetical protein [Planctomycetaceae bacterium]